MTEEAATKDNHKPTMTTRASKSKHWYPIPQYHGYSEEKLNQLYDELPQITKVKQIGFEWKVYLDFENSKKSGYVPFLVAAERYHGRVTCQLQTIANEMDETVVNQKEWNDFVEWTEAIGKKYVCFVFVCKRIF